VKGRRETSDGVSRINTHITGNYSSSGTSAGYTRASKDSIGFNEAKVQG